MSEDCFRLECVERRRQLAEANAALAKANGDAALWRDTAEEHKAQLAHAREVGRRTCDALVALIDACDGNHAELTEECRGALALGRETFGEMENRRSEDPMTGAERKRHESTDSMRVLLGRAADAIRAHCPHHGYPLKGGHDSGCCSRHVRPTDGRWWYCALGERDRNVLAEIDRLLAAREEDPNG